MVISSTQWAVALIAVLLALWMGHNNGHWVHQYQFAMRRWVSTRLADTTITTPTAKPARTTSTSTGRDHRESLGLTIYAIGDLHGDVECARQWVSRTHVIIDSAHHRNHRWRDEAVRLVFVGDYVDKGITSRQTLEYVKNLTETFPKYVTAIMGNHELELLRDRTETLWGNGHAGYYQVGNDSEALPIHTHTHL
jgi:Calcineurin-like phosphoesterase